VVVPERIGEGMLYFDKGAELEVDLRLETLVDGILATADVRGTLTGNCSRCLQPLEEGWSGHVAEMFGYQADESLEYALDGDVVNLEGPIRDAVVLDLPFQPLCEPGCLGLDPVTGEKPARGGGGGRPALGAARAAAAERRRGGFVVGCALGGVEQVVGFDGAGVA